ncbi:response regulator transcription factor [Magnetospira sp. QH-2]|uniref:response regulator transcription factor n=1 Tax=Magnetospira sp. (strain QH-2) TaxID=1288970 RepID=UPI0003E80BCD|nr:response regulator transcription factor [Magnetospira sp. QH-2]CCQ72592.1 protein of unknown function [Magnetospira sp. QH-2]
MIQKRPNNELGTRITVAGGEGISWMGIQQGQGIDMEKVCCLLAMGNAEMRRMVHAVLSREGMGAIQESWDVETTETQLKTMSPDLIIVDAGIAESMSEATHMVKKLRLAALSSNPYAVVLALMANPSSEEVMAWVNAGVDDLVAHPVSPKVLLDRLSIQVEARRPFVVTSEYLGPERRNRQRPGVSIEQIAVPNTFGEKVRGTYDGESIDEQISDMVSHLRTRRVECQAARILQMIKILRPMFQQPEAHDLLVNRLRQMGLIILEMGRHLSNTPYEEVNGLCATLHGLVKRLGSEKRDPEDMKKLDEAARKLAVAFNIETSEPHQPMSAAAE